MARARTMQARVDRNREIRNLYRTHPLRKQSILKRILDHKGTLSRITEMDLAEDTFTEITDQNHIGGAKFVRDLAQKAGVGPATDVLDLGCGLGGSARCLAYFFGCRVHGVDLSVERSKEARQLTKLVGLDHLVAFQCGDLLRIALPRRRFDILWSQAAWVHIEDKERLIKKWSKALKAGGRIALEEAYVKRHPRHTTERHDLDELADHWKSYLVGLDDWTEILASQSFQVYCKEDLSTQLGNLSRKLIRLTHNGVMTDVPETEQKSWELTVKLVRKGIIGYFRLVAKKLK
jgi:SAM-dependent methyltransferase